MEKNETESSRFYDFLAWLEVNKKAAIGVLVALILLGVSFYVYTWYQGEREKKAHQALASLKTAAAPGTSVSSDDYLKISKEFSGTSAGGQAILLAAGALFSEGKYSQAQQLFQNFLDRNKKSPLAPEALLGVATSLESQGKAPEALARYQELPSRYPESYLVPQAKLGQARILEVQGKQDQALRIYRDLSQTMGSAGPQAALKMENLLRENPSLAGTNNPAIPIPGEAPIPGEE